MEKLHLPIRWYIAEINHLQSELNSLPDIRCVEQRGVPVARMRRNQKVHQYGPRHAEYEKAIKIARQRSRILERIRLLKGEWRSYFADGFERVQRNYLITKNNVSPFNNNYWKQLVDNECTVENPHNYNWDGHNFRSRFELAVAEAARDLHLTYKYDSGIRLEDRICYMDFAFSFECFNRTSFCECFGQMGTASYVSRSTEKIHIYSSNGIYLNRDLFTICADANYVPNEYQIKHTLISMVEILCDSYMTRVEE